MKKRMWIIFTIDVNSIFVQRCLVHDLLSLFFCTTLYLVKNIMLIASCIVRYDFIKKKKTHNSISILCLQRNSNYIPFKSCKRRLNKRYMLHIQYENINMF